MYPMHSQPLIEAKEYVVLQAQHYHTTVVCPVHAALGRERGAECAVLRVAVGIGYIVGGSLLDVKTMERNRKNCTVIGYAEIKVSSLVV